MRRSARLGEKQISSKNEAEREPKAKKSRPVDRIPNIAAMDNGTMLEAFKFLNYYQLATNSLVSKRYWNVIRTHRHRLALLDVGEISMHSYVPNQDHAVIKMFNKKLSPEEYSEWIVRNGYSKQIPFDGQIAGKKTSEIGRNIYELYVSVYENPNNYHHIAATVFIAKNVKLKDETWPLFHHFFRLLMDPFVYVRILAINHPKYALTLMAGAMNPDRDLLQCKLLSINFNDDFQKFIVWIKDHVRCNEFEIRGNSDLNYDKELLDFLTTGAHCTSAIYVRNYDVSEVIVDLVQCDVKDVDGRRAVEALKRNCAEFIAKEEKYEERRSTKQNLGFINNVIEKKLKLSVRNGPYGSFSIKITNL